MQSRTPWIVRQSLFARETLSESGWPSKSIFFEFANLLHEARMWTGLQRHHRRRSRISKWPWQLSIKATETAMWVQVLTGLGYDIHVLRDKRNYESVDVDKTVNCVEGSISTKPSDRLVTVVELFQIGGDPHRRIGWDHRSQFSNPLSETHTTVLVKFKIENHTPPGQNNFSGKFLEMATSLPLWHLIFGWDQSYSLSTTKNPL